MAIGGGSASSSQLPSDQQTFVDAVDGAAADYKAAGSDLRRSLAAKNAPTRWCAALSGPAVTGWVGKVADVNTTLDYATIRVEISDRAEVRTTTTWVFDRETLITPGTPLFNQVGNLKEGRKVRFSGKFILDSSTCLRETSVSDSGQAETPDFLFQFVSVEPI